MADRSTASGAAPTPPRPSRPRATSPAVPDPWPQHWGQVPAPWRDGVYAIDADPFKDVFVQNARYQRGRAFDFRPPGPHRLAQETAWWIWTCHHEGLRKIEPSMLRWWAAAVGSLTTRRSATAGRAPASIADLEPHLVAREAVRLFAARNGRPPSPGNLRNLISIADHVHLLVSVRTSPAPWWTHDVWDLRVDDRIPRRAHEPAADQIVNLAGIDPPWLREALRFWLSTALTYQLFRWTTVVTRARNLGTYLGRYLTEQHVTDPTIAPAPAEIRAVFTGFAGWLSSPAATTTGRPLAGTGISAVLSHTQGMYTYLLDHNDDLITATGDDRWEGLNEAHARLFAHQPTGRRTTSTATPGASVIGPSDLARMIACLEILSAPTSQVVTVALPGGEEVTARGIGDPQAARAWLLQALTGRRVSEILMLDFDPLTAVPGLDPTRVEEGAFVARLRYQQTKIDDVDATILVDATVVALVAAQQAWARGHVDPGVTPPYLFLNPRHNHRGTRPRSYGSHLAALRRLNQATALTDAVGKPLAFTRTHRLRHTRATELLNAGVPIHVVQRYLGHKSPEMTMHYAATLAHTAEAEFLKAHRVGAFGSALVLQPADLLEITQLEARADRALPNGLCTLPPAKTCDRGNACLTCGHFATDNSHLGEHQDQQRRTLRLIEVRQDAFTRRHGQPMPEENIWLRERRRELDSLHAIINALTAAPDQSAVGAGASRRHLPESPPA
jgi:integrase